MEVCALRVVGSGGKLFWSDGQKVVGQPDLMSLEQALAYVQDAARRGLDFQLVRESDLELFVPNEDIEKFRQLIKAADEVCDKESRYSLDQQAVLKAIPDFLDLPIDEAMQRFDELISDGSIRLASISYSPQMHWSLGRHCRDYPLPEAGD